MLFTAPLFNELAIFITAQANGTAQQNYVSWPSCLQAMERFLHGYCFKYVKHTINLGDLHEIDLLYVIAYTSTMLVKHNLLDTLSPIRLSLP